MNSVTLIIGASRAGVQLAVALRELGDTGPIMLVGAERRPPYQRPPLTKAFLAGKTSEESLALRTTEFYAAAGIRLICSERVTKLSLSPTGERGSGTAITEAGRVLPFDRLALAVGARPRRIGVPGADLDGVCYLRDVDDAVSLRDRIAVARNIVIVGGGFIGLETAAVATSQGKNVTIVEATERLISRSVAPIVSRFYLQAHMRRGADVRLGVGITAFRGEQRQLTHVQLSDGEQLPVDVALIGIGAMPRTELAEQLGLACRGGIVVDEFARTSNQSIVAAGDCTVMPNPTTSDETVRLESVQNAIEQARVAAATLAGKPAPYRAIPWFWSDQDNLKLQIAGLTTGHDEHVLRGDLDTERFSVLYYRGGRLIGIEAVNRTPDYLIVRQALNQGRTIPAEKAADSGVSLKTLLADDVAVQR